MQSECAHRLDNNNDNDDDPDDNNKWENDNDNTNENNFIQAQAAQSPAVRWSYYAITVVAEL